MIFFLPSFPCLYYSVRRMWDSQLDAIYLSLKLKCWTEMKWLISLIMVYCWVFLIVAEGYFKRVMTDTCMCAILTYQAKWLSIKRGYSSGRSLFHQNSRWIFYTQRLGFDTCRNWVLFVFECRTTCVNLLMSWGVSAKRAHKANVFLRTKTVRMSELCFSCYTVFLLFFLFQGDTTEKLVSDLPSADTQI